MFYDYFTDVAKDVCCNSDEMDYINAIFVRPNHASVSIL